MKTKINYSFEKVLAILFVSTLFILSSCSGNNSDSTKDNKSVPSPPKVDLHTATITSDINSVKLHIEAGSDLNPKDEILGSTPLITAVVFGKTEIARALIEGGADLNMSNNEGSTPLYCAAFFGRTELASILIEKGADKSIRNNFGSTALETVSVPFETIKGIYDQISKDLGPLGLKLDYTKLQEARIEIAAMLGK